MFKPSALKPGDTIGIVSPASPIQEKHLETFQRGIDLLKESGYNILLGKHVFDNNGYLAGEDRDRAGDINEMFADSSVKAIICSRGGYGCERIIDYLDLSIIRSNPKIFIGYSNISYLLNIFVQHADLITFHGPMVINLSSNQYNIKNLLNTITLNRSVHILNKIPCSSYYRTNSKASGIIIGGNLSTFIGSIGTKYEIDTSNRILFIEEINEEAYSIDRLLTHLNNSGKLKSCSGFILGDFTDCSDSNRISCFDVLSEVLFPLDKPAIYSFRSGHGTIKTTIPFGANAEIDAKNGFVKIVEDIIE